MSDLQRHAPAILSLRDIYLTLRSAPFSLDIALGDRIAFLSDSAATASALCDIIAGFDRPLAGRVELLGIDLSERAPQTRPIGSLSVRDPLFSHLSIDGNVAFPLRARRNNASQIQAELTRVRALAGLESFIDIPVSTLSAEQVFRVKLARLLAFNPQVVVLDDPFYNLDPPAVKKVHALLLTLSRALKLTLIFTLYRRDDALLLGDKIALFAQETLLQAGDAHTIYERPTSVRAARFFSETNCLTGSVISIESDVATLRLACGGIGEAIAASNLEEGALCTLCIRPDRLVPLFDRTAEDEALNSPEAKITDVRHHGDHLRIRLKMHDGEEIEMRRPLFQSHHAFAKDAIIFLGWHPSQAIAFPYVESHL